ncbi:MAG: flavodoxin family protein [Planctomycetes bacterium]|nr:flavodoxin family protein [Planctomycetota bacterium]
MAKVLIVYYSESGNTAKMAQLVEEGAKKAGADVTLKKVQDVNVDDLLGYDALIVGSPTYYGQMAAEIKKMFDESVKFHGKLEGKVGAAFTSAANIGGGNETTIQGILECMLIHGMIVQGNHQGDHYGPVSIGAPDERVEKQCGILGERTAQLADKIK